MENILLAVNLVLAVILVLLILIQKSEGGALGIGVSQDNFMLSRSAGNFMSKATAVVATLFRRSASLFYFCCLFLRLTVICEGSEAPPRLSVAALPHPLGGTSRNAWCRRRVRLTGTVAASSGRRCKNSAKLLYRLEVGFCGGKRFTSRFPSKKLFT